MIGQKFNRWTVIDEAPSRNNKKYWLCKCDCGTIRAVNATDLRNGKSKSCGCLKRERASETHKKNLINQKFGRLTVISEKGRTPNQSVIWHCKCECGNECDVVGSQLISGHTQSCGCLQKERTSEASRINIIGKKFGQLTVLDGFKNINNKLYRECQCTCGTKCYVETSQLTTNHTISCGCLKTSKGEQKIEEILKENNILYEKEKTFNTCFFEDTKKLARFDFYLPKLNILIEYDGIQHYIIGTGIYDNEEKFNKTQEHDELKNQWCKENNILLIRIPYTHYDNLNIQDLLPETSTFIV